MDIQKIKTLGELKESDYKSRPIKEELRENLIKKISKKEITFPGIIGYEDSVIPDTERALLSRHNILFLGLRGLRQVGAGHPFDSQARERVASLAARHLAVP